MICSKTELRPDVGIVHEVSSALSTGWAFFVQKMNKEQTQAPDFILHGTMQLSKSVESAQAVTDGTAKRRLIYGEITNGNLDEENERMIAKSLDFSYFDDQGWIKYEHVANDPSHIIGAPHERYVTESGGVVIKGALFSGKKYSDATWELIESIEEHNRLYPEHQKTLGWSIEGQYTDTKTSKGGVRKAKVINVVVTPNPVNKSVYLSALKENHAMFAKSLMGDNYQEDVEKAMSAGEGTGSEMTHLDELSGGRAITKENIDDEIKETAEDIGGTEDVKKKKKKSAISKSQRSSTMFENMEQAVKHFTDLGKDEDEAQELAKSFFSDDAGEGEDTGDDAGAEAEDVGKLSKAIDALTEKFGNILNKSQSADDGGEAQGADEFETLPGGEEDYIDAAPMLLSIEKSVGDTLRLVEEKVKYDHERDQILATALDEVNNMKADLSKAIATVQKSVQLGEGDNTVNLADAMNALLKSRSGQPVDLASLQIAGEGDGGGSGAAPRTSWKEMQDTLAKGVNANELTQQQVSTAESAHRTGEFEVVKSITDLVTV